jgi:hypothetical protein
VAAPVSPERRAILLRDRQKRVGRREDERLGRATAACQPVEPFLPPGCRKKGDIALCLGEAEAATKLCLHVKALCPPFLSRTAQHEPSNSRRWGRFSSSPRWTPCSTGMSARFACFGWPPTPCCPPRRCRLSASTRRPSNCWWAYAARSSWLPRCGAREDPGRSGNPCINGHGHLVEASETALAACDFL